MRTEELEQYLQSVEERLRNMNERLTMIERKHDSDMKDQWQYLKEIGEKIEMVRRGDI